MARQKSIGEKIVADKAHKIMIKYTVETKDADLAFSRLDDVGRLSCAPVFRMISR